MDISTIIFKIFVIALASSPVWFLLLMCWFECRKESKLPELKNRAIKLGLAEYDKNSGDFSWKEDKHLGEPRSVKRFYRNVYSIAKQLGHVEYDNITGNSIHNKSPYTDILKSKINPYYFMREGTTRMDETECDRVESQY